MKPPIEKSSPSRPPGTRTVPVGTKPEPRHSDGAEAAPEKKAASAEHHADGSETGAATPSARPKPNIDVAGLLEAARDKAEEAGREITMCGWLLAQAFAHMLELRRLCDAVDSAKEDLAAAYAAAGIKVTKRTLNAFTPLVKLVFGRELPRTDVNRYANVLWLAYERDVGAWREAFETFVWAAGGIAACAEKAAAARRAGTRDALELPVDRVLKAQRKAARRIRLPALEFLPQANLMTVLLERTADDRFLILGARPATPGSARRYLPARRA